MKITNTITLILLACCTSISAAQPALSWITVDHNKQTYYFSNSIDCKSFIMVDKRSLAGNNGHCQAQASRQISPDADIRTANIEASKAGGMSGTVIMMRIL